MKTELALTYKKDIKYSSIFLKNSLSLGQVFLVSLILKLGYVACKVNCDVMRLIS